MKVATQLNRHQRHDHFWIEDEVLYESYQTIRGMRFLQILDVPGMPDDDNVSEAGIKYIEAEYLT